uniref:Sde2 N-terminal ubiquitin domain-containing protein n=1 Tax=Globodera rostochiensis TaxID=31243 RepID=A0A914HKL5_GLORO
MTTVHFFTKSDKKSVKFVNELPRELYFLECDGQVFHNLSDIDDGKLVQLHFRVCGGKGGFGSLLRSFRIHKSSNQLMCRNLQGRRLADVREEERLKKYIAKKAEREKEKQKKKEDKIERLKACGRAKHQFDDQKYLRKRDTLLDDVEDAIEAGVSALGETPISSELLEVTVSEEAVAGCSSSTEHGQVEDSPPRKEPSVVDSSDSDIDLDEMMSIGPLKKKY